MNRNKLITISALAACCLLLSDITLLANKKTQPQKPPQQNQVVQVPQDQIYEEKASTGEIEVHFHGKVIDDQNNPVAGAYVHAQIIPSDQNKETEKRLVKTDPNGSFKLNGTGQTIEIKTIRKSGYKFPKSKNKKIFQSSDIAPEETTVFKLEKSGLFSKIL